MNFPCKENCTKYSEPNVNSLFQKSNQLRNVKNEHSILGAWSLPKTQIFLLKIGNFEKVCQDFGNCVRGGFRAVVNIVMVGSNLFHKTQVMKFVNARLYLDFQSICHGESSAYMQKALKRFSTTENIKLNLLNFFHNHMHLQVILFWWKW